MPLDSAMMPTIANRKLPRKVASAFCAVVSSMRSCTARGVMLLVAPEYACTIAVSEKVVTASIDDASRFRMLSTALAPILVAKS